MRSVLLSAVLLGGCVSEPEGIDDLDAIPADGLPVDMAAPPPTLRITHPVIGGKITFRIEGALPNETIYILRGTSQGQGTCLPQLGGRCTNLTGQNSLFTTFSVDADGFGEKKVNIPNIAAINGQSVCFQGAAIRGAGGSQSELTSVRCGELGFDADGDQIIDRLDICGSGDDFYDYDKDNTPDACDAAGDRAPFYRNVTPVVPWNKGTYQGRTVQWYIPPNPAGLLFVFHGTGGDSEVAEDIDMIDILNDLVPRGYGFMAISSEVRQNAMWNTSDPPNNNPDFQRIKDWRQSKINSGDLAANTPIFAYGFSNGGSMVGYLTHVAAAQGIPLHGGVVHGSTARSDLHGPPEQVPMFWMSSRWDDVVQPADILAKHQDYQQSNWDSTYRQVPEGRIAPTMFDRSDNVTLQQSQDIFKEVVNDGWFDKGGVRLFSSVNIDGTIDQIGADPAIYPQKPAKGVLSAALATHAINGYYAVEVGDFLDAH